MKPLELVPDHNILLEFLHPGSPYEVSIFTRSVREEKFFPDTEKGEWAQIAANNYHTQSFERSMMFFENRCPTWPEMVEMKKLFWNDADIVFQVHPKKEDYVNICKTALHLWRPKDRHSIIKLRAVRPLIIKTLSLIRTQATSSELSFRESTIEGKRFVAIFCGNKWPTWEQVCSIKKHCFGENQTALQFNLSPELDLNPYHILLLWNARDFDIVLPPKDYV